ncbi:hypothetical protein E3J84_03935 [Candidatus Aerophobetes bacterium]|uniref:Uncharacterized protein n=1 Tax=Aerophobetes bacterium TaxID=2030807 RepID=A0A523RXK2_UNCAE|nr:MAG: hypothetical protein E3J84_03935 [Candidatus Aerophobetes bacterium]
MNDQDWLDYVRSLIGETEASFKMWTPEEVAIYKKVGITTVLAEFWNLLAVTHKRIAKCAMTANDPYISLPVITTTVDLDSAVDQKVLSVAATTGFTKGGIVIIGEGTVRQEVRLIGSVQVGVSLTMFENLEYTHTAVQADAVELQREIHKVVRVEYASTGKKLDYIEDDKLFLYETGGSGAPQVWLFEDNQVRQVPTPASTEAEYWRVWYLPEFTVLSQLPDILHPLIALEAVINARIKDERLMRALLLKRDHLSGIAMGTLAIAQLQEPGAISPFDSSEEDED